MRSLVSSGVSWPKSSKPDMERAVAEAADLDTARLPVKAEVTATITQAMKAMRTLDWECIISKFVRCVSSV